MFKHLEVNIFPSVHYDLCINIRRDEAAALQQYFKLEVRLLWAIWWFAHSRKNSLNSTRHFYSLIFEYPYAHDIKTSTYSLRCQSLSH